MQSFGDRLRQLREASGLTQQQLADASGINLWTIRGYEQGRREPNWKGALQLAHALGVQAEAFADCISKDEGETSIPPRHPTPRPPEEGPARGAAGRRAAGRGEGQAGEEGAEEEGVSMPPRKLGFTAFAAPVTVLTEHDDLFPECDGYAIGVGMEPMPGDATATVALRQGTDPVTAAQLLRRIADLIERDGAELLNLPHNHKWGGWLTEAGTIKWESDEFPDPDPDDPPA